jgi:hypothetical protein
VEAHAAAAAVCGGRPFTCTLADRPDIPRAWAYAGHYYTVYLLMLAARIDRTVAQRAAFYAQVADQVAEFDAKHLGFDMIKQGCIGVAGCVAAGPVSLLTRVPVVKNAFSNLQNDQIVQMGLHALTGRLSGSEEALRQKRLQAEDFTSDLRCFRFGLAAHAYGDSFAHRTLDRSENMYSAGAGHAVEIAHGKDPTEPDWLHLRPALYIKYGRTLYELICTKRQARTEEPMAEEDVLVMLKTIARQTGDDNQVRLIRDLARQELGTPMTSYRPESEDLSPWKEFQVQHRLSPELLGEALRVARAWAGPN